MELCNDETFNAWQHNFILETHYKPVYDKILTTFKDAQLFKDMSSRDEEALKEMCISLSVQHGGAYRIFQMALLKDFTCCSNEEILDINDENCSAKGEDFPLKNNKNNEQIEQMRKTANKITMSTFIDRVYAARKLYVKAYNVPDWKNMVKHRYKDEPATLKHKFGYEQ